MTAATTRLTQPPLQPILLWRLTQTPYNFFGACALIVSRSLPLARPLPHGFTGHVAVPNGSIVSRSLPLGSTAHPRGCTGHVADSISSIETRSLPALARCFPRSFTFYVAHPTRSIHSFLAA